MNMQFDTLAAVKRIEAASLDRGTAEAAVAEIAAAQVELADKGDVTILLRDAAATKNELQSEFAANRAENTAFRAELRSEFATIRAENATTKPELRTEIVAVKADIIRWMFGSQIFLIVALVALAQFTKVL